jgi:hypothetical protein
MKSFAPQFSALMTTVRSDGPVILTRRSARPGASRQRPCCASSGPARNSGSTPRPARRRGPRDPGSSARRGPNVPFSVASISSAPAVSTRSQLPSQDAPVSTPGTLGGLLMRYPSQTCVRLAPQRRNSPTATLVRDWQTITSWPAGWVLPPSLTGRRSAGLVLLRHLVYATATVPLKDRTGSSGMRFKASRSGPALTNIRQGDLISYQNSGKGFHTSADSVERTVRKYVWLCIKRTHG